MTTQDLLAVLEEGLNNGRIAPHLAAFIAGEVLDVDSDETGYDDWVQVETTEDAEELVEA